MFHLNLLASVVMILFWIFATKGRSLLQNPGRAARVFKRVFFRKSYWWNPSTRVDCKIYLVNSLFKILLFFPFLDFSFQISMVTLKYLVKFGGPLTAGMVPGYFALLSFSIFAFVWDDALRFSHHALMHRIPWLWKIHQTHHSATTLTPLTLFRIHPLESALAMLRNSLSLGVAAGIFLYLFDAEFSLATILGVNFFGFAFNLLGSNLRHSHIPVSFGFMEYLFISPFQHQLHHSNKIEHFDKNFGVSLSVWDLVYGSFVSSKQVRGRLEFGLSELRPDSMTEILAQPFLIQEIPEFELQSQESVI